jgi:tape measure domain-containing protein
MAAVTTELKIKITKVGEAQLTKLSASLNQVAKRADAAKIDFKSLASELKKVQTTTGPKSVSDLRNYRNAWRDIADSVDVASKEFKEATAEAAKLDKQLQKTTSRRGARLKAAGGVAATALGAGVFGGVEGFVGALGGGILGGVPGAAAGAVAGATLGNLRKQAGLVAELVAEYNSMQIALAGVSKSQADYNKSLQSVTQFSKDFLIPIGDAIGQYTRLKASVVGAGGSTEDTDKAFRGMAAAILATGGNINDFNSALVATAQVFSKGKVSAEELRQQIGERLPGAFTIFADSMGISTRELDEMLERGEVRLSSFGDFTEDLFKRYRETSQVLGSAPEKAGQRLQVALNFAAIKFGSFFQKVGAGFQDYLTNLINFAIDNEKALKLTAAKFLAFGEQIVNTIKTAAKNMAGALKPFFDFAGRALSALASRFATAQREIAVRGKGVDPMNIYGSVLEGYKVEQGIGGPGNVFLSMEDKEEVRRRYVEALGTFLGESTFKQLTNKYLDMFEGFTPTEFGSAVRDGFSDLNGGDEDTTQTAKAIKDITKKELDLRKAIVLARRFEDELAQLQLGADLKRLQVLGAQIGERERIARLLEIEQEEAEGFAAIVEKQIKLIEDKEKAEFRAGQEIAKQLNQQDKLQKKTKEALTDTQELIQSIGGVISGGLTDAFQSLITGAKSLKEILADVLRQIGQLFLQFAIRQALSSINIGGVPLVPNAKGNVFAQNKIIPYANGGVIDKPTILPLAGEAGPEAILPLQRGSDGKLGVKSNESRMRESMSRYSRGARGGSVISENGGGGNVIDGGGGTAVAAPIDVRYTVERINSVDYVTADQFQQGLQQAANQGAKQGEQQTLKRLQMSSSTRKRIGM